ncbi:Plant PDR ABC transporter associated [Dillenia turbinata]|uniref:Plant PDR ABC transporter associated n=1 Tax=Dillenia turbinata TaxID=194707 RepID=A0AAN8Z9U3_9MAGN
MELSSAALLHCSSLESDDSSCGDYFSTADYLEQEEEENEHVALEWAAIERRLRTSLLFDVDHVHDHGQNKKVVDVTKLAPLEQHLFIEMLIKHIQNDNLRLLQKIRERLDRVNVDLPCVEVRYKNVCMEAECDVVKGKPLPTLWNSIASTFSGSMFNLQGLTKIICCNRRDTKISILRDVNGVLKPRRLTLLLGPPGCGKTSFLLALAGSVERSLKAIAAEGKERSLQTDYILKILGLDLCADVMVGDAIRRGISGGQRKRLTTASTSLCRLVASIFQTMVAAFTLGTLLLLLILLFGGFVLPRSSMPEWLKWGFWVSPMTYGEMAVSGNEFLAPRWQKPSIRNMTIGKNVLVSHGLNFESYYYWISVGALFGMMMLFDLGFTLALTYMKPPRRPKHIISEEKLTGLQARGDNGRRHLNKPIAAGFSESMSEPRKQGRMVLPFEPLTMTFKDVQYYVDTPKKIPKWWRWCYWICPTSWSLSALLTSQYGDVDRGVLIFGENTSVSQFLDDYYGFKEDHLAYVAIVLMAFPVVFASGFAYYISKLNFQQR